MRCAREKEERENPTIPNCCRPSTDVDAGFDVCPFAGDGQDVWPLTKYNNILKLFIKF